MTVDTFLLVTFNMLFFAYLAWTIWSDQHPKP